MAWVKLWINGQNLHCNNEKERKGKAEDAVLNGPFVLVLRSLHNCSQVKILHLYVSWIYNFWQDIFL